MSMRTLEDAFLEELYEFRDAEAQLAKAIPAMANRTSDDALRQLLNGCLQECEIHRKRLEGVFAELGKPSRTKTCYAMAGFVRDATVIEWLEVKDHHNRAVDALLLATVKKIVRYAIATYETLHQWAKIMELEQAESLLRQNLEEAKTVDYKLNEIGLTVNEAALVGRVT